FTVYLAVAYTPAPSAVVVPPPSLVPEGANGNLDLTRAAMPALASMKAKSASLLQLEVEDDQSTIQPGDRVLLIIEDDVPFAQVLLGLAHDRGFKGRIALRGDMGMALAEELHPNAITLDIRLPDMSGWTVLDQLKHNENIRHVPVHIISVEEDWRRGLTLGAASFLNKSVTKEALAEEFTKIQSSAERQVRKLLVVEPDQARRREVLELIGNTDVHTTTINTAQEALGLLKAEHFDCVVLDSKLPDMSAYEVIEQIQQAGGRELPVIVYAGRGLSAEEEIELRRVAEHSVVKRVSSLERLLAETALFLHRVKGNLPQPARHMLDELQGRPLVGGGKILIVDDDVRNLFALTSVLERHDLQVLHAESGGAGIRILESTPGIDLVLMDVMMPEMDGYETMRAIREKDRFHSLPIIAVTAKAMKGDREKCIEAGASDYITKPVEPEELISLLRVWLPARAEEPVTHQEAVGD